MNVKSIHYNTIVRAALPSLSFYFILIGASLLLEVLFSSGPCTAGAGVLLIFLMPFLSLFLLVRNCIKALRYQHIQYKIPVLVHFTGCILQLLVYFLILH